MNIGIVDIVTILPEIIVILGACFILLVDFIIPDDRKCVIPILAVATIAVAAVATAVLAYFGFGDAIVFSGMFSADGYATFFKFILYTAVVLTILLSVRSNCKCHSGTYTVRKSAISGEYYVLILFALSGMMVMASGRDLLSLYIGMELMSLPIYTLVAFKDRDKRSVEGAMKYVILGAFSSAVMLFGISLIYGFTGTTALLGVSEALATGSLSLPAVSVAVVMLVAGFGFKIAGVPFHMWAPDAYEGAPTPITAFMSTASKAAAFAMMLRVFMEGLYPLYDDWYVLLAVVSIASMAYGNFVAIAQKNIKRMLAYSSIGHAGYALLGLISGTAEGVASVIFYMAVYTFMNFGIFAVIMLMGSGKGEKIEDYTGLAKKHKGLAAVMLIFLFSLAGIPPMAGFMAKFYVFLALIHQGMLTIAIIGVLMSAVAAYFYIRIVMVMYMKEPEGELETRDSRTVSFVLIVSLIGVVVLGIYPDILITLANAASNIL